MCKHCILLLSMASTIKIFCISMQVISFHSTHSWQIIHCTDVYMYVQYVDHKMAPRIKVMTNLLKMSQLLIYLFLTLSWEWSQNEDNRKIIEVHEVLTIKANGIAVQTKSLFGK